MAEARIKTNFGEIAIEYSTLEELSRALEDVLKAVALVQSKTTGLVPAEPQKAKPGSEHVYRYDPNGQLQLLKKPSKKVALTALVLYAKDPEPMSPSNLEFVTGIHEIARYVLTQTMNKKYFARKPDGRYGLSPFGFAWVSAKVIPALK